MTLTSGFSSSKVEPRAYLYIILGRNPKFGVRIYFGIMACRIYFCMRGSKIFSEIGGLYRPNGQKTVRTIFFSPQLILQFTEGIQWFYCRENYTFQGSRGGPTFSRGGGVQRFPREGEGGPNANFYKNPYTL